ncbi:hypothetical protein [Mammaliicoccus sciuri]|uniref:hypothetical protein n=1 Tax=Mammaliicoccus sciuri TaxID=1296 RepID=UPI002119C07D|nr:hypothetical protein [Mammaliicoccus sciuri]
MWEEKGDYNPKTSKYEKRQLIYDEIPCNLSPISTQRLVLEFGDISRKISIVRVKVKGRYDKLVSHAHINGVKYKVIRPIFHRHDTAFYVESVD